MSRQELCTSWESVHANRLSFEDGWGLGVKISECVFWSGGKEKVTVDVHGWRFLQGEGPLLSSCSSGLASCCVVPDHVTGSGSLTPEAGIGCRSDQVLSALSYQPDFWGTDCRHRHYWCHPGSRGLKKVQEGEPQG